MSMSTRIALAERAREAALSVAWAQWGGLNPSLIKETSAKPLTSIVDPEALVLASLVLWEDEHRLVDVLSWWAGKGATLMSLRRIDSLRPAFPKTAHERLDHFAAWAKQAGDSRWKPATSSDLVVRAGKGPSELVLNGSATLLLKLRAGFGVSAKPDILAFLLALDGQGAPAKEIAQAVGYADKNVRAAAGDLTMGGFIEERETYPVEYAARHGFAAGLVRLLTWDRSGEKAPDWNHWSAIYAFLLHVAMWSEEAVLAQPYVLSSRARDLFEQYRWVFRRADLRLPDPNRYPGEQYLGAFSETLKAVSEWVGKHV